MRPKAGGRDARALEARPRNRSGRTGSKDQEIVAVEPGDGGLQRQHAPCHLQAFHDRWCRRTALHAPAVLDEDVAGDRPHTDMRKGFAPLALLVQEKLAQDPHAGRQPHASQTYAR
jgi:hypothetical protein